ncbi:MAG: CcmD family protein [Anaerolineae bacterium]|jgi:CcmD family protein
MSVPVYLVAAYAVFWVLTFVLVFSIWRRQSRLEREITALEARLGQRKREAE